MRKGFRFCFRTPHTFSDYRPIDLLIKTISDYRVLTSLENLNILEKHHRESPNQKKSKKNLKIFEKNLKKKLRKISKS